jgi:hypothetical protein
MPAILERARRQRILADKLLRIISEPTSAIGGAAIRRIHSQANAVRLLSELSINSVRVS